jgi:two-component system LytT family sensor kinase
LVKAQVIAAFAIITLFNVGFYWERQLSALTARRQLPSLISAWDGFEWYVWLAAVPAILFLIRRFPLVHPRVVRHVIGLMLGSCGICLLVVNARYALRLLPNVWLPDAADLPTDAFTYLHTQLVLAPIDFLTYVGLFATSFAIDYNFKYRQRAKEALQLQLRTMRLESELARAQLVALRSQLRPHFFFNAFNAISTLVRQHKNDVAVEMIAELSGLLRMAMENAGLQEVTLERELEFVMHYLTVERVRFGDKLRSEVTAPPDTLPAIVPSMLLQPLAGNAIKHAISRRTTPGTIRIDARRVGQRLIIEVADDGPGESPAPPPKNRTGVGLANTRARLGAVCGDDYTLEMNPRPEGGMVVHLDLPWRTTPGVAQSSAVPA